MNPLRPRLSFPTGAELEELRARAHELALPAPVEAELESLQLYVGFRLGDSACAVDSALVTQAVMRLTRIEPLAHHAGRVRGVAFVENRPHLVLDLLEARHTTRDLPALEKAPGFVVQTDAGAWLVAVEGPLELIDGQRLSPIVDRHDQAPGQLRLSGRLDGGAFVLSAEWLRGWVQSLGEAA